MRHLFIINPAADKIRGRVGAVIEDIKSFFHRYEQLEYDIHVTLWIRDASAFVHRYVLGSDSLVRIHSFGGSGTLFEIVNGIIGLPNVQIAAYPMGKNNSFLRYFGLNSVHLFGSMRNQVFSSVTPIDALRCGKNYGISYGLIGLEAESIQKGVEMISRSYLRSDLYYILPAVSSVFKKKRLGRGYRISLDDMPLDGNYITMMIANVPGYGRNMNPAVDAHPNDGRFDIYLAKDMTKPKFIASIPKYLNGRYDRTAGRIVHYTGKKLVVCSDSEMCLAVDGETFYENSIEYEIMPYAIDLVCPPGIDPERLPRTYGRTEEG